MKTLFKCVLVVVASLHFGGCRSAFKVTHDPIAENLTLSSAKSALPPEAFRASIVLAYPIATTLKTGTRTSVHLILKNLSGYVWPATGVRDGKYQIRVGNHWLDNNQQAIDDGRAPLSFDLHPGEAMEVLITVTAPKSPGDYVLQFDVVQEQVAWFHDWRSEPLQIKVKVA